MPDLGGSCGLVASLVNIRSEYGTTDYLAGTAVGGEDHHGLRLLCVDTGGWSHLRHRHPMTGGISLEEPPHHPHVLARRVQLQVHRHVMQDRAMGGCV